MKKILLTILLIAAFGYSYAQNTFPLSGNVGIGTTSPSTNLQINYNTANGSGLSLNNANNSAFLTLQVNGSLGYNVPNWANSTVLESVPVSGGGLVLSSYTGDINFQTSNRNTRMIVTSAGNVGIGSANPQAAFDVTKLLNSGELGAVLARLPEGNPVGAGTYLGVRGYDTQVNGSVTNINNVKSFAIEHSFYGEVNSSINFLRGAGQGGGSIAFNTNDNTEKMRIMNNGNIGIGTIAPDAKLTVAGTIHASEIKVDATIPTTDYVFDRGYNLKNLKDVKSYIDKNHHLPEILSAEQVAREGINVGEMNAMLLKKIEELTLYLITKDKEDQKRKNEIGQLRKELKKLSATVHKKGK